MDPTSARVAELDGRDVEIYMEEEPGSSGKVVIDHYSRDVLKRYCFRGNRSTGNKEVMAKGTASVIHQTAIRIATAAARVTSECSGSRLKKSKSIRLSTGPRTNPNLLVKLSFLSKS